MKKASILTATFLWVSCLNAQVIYQTHGFLLEINSKAEVVKLVDRQNNVNYVSADHPGYLVRVKTTSKKELAPIKMQADKNLLYFSFAEGIALQVKIAAKATPLRFELVKTKSSEKSVMVFVSGLSG